MEDKMNSFCYYEWGGLLVIIFGAFALGYRFSQRNFSAHRRGLIIAGGVAVGNICVAIITCVMVSWHRKRQAVFDEEDLVVPACEQIHRQPTQQPPTTTTTTTELHSSLDTSSQQK
ncbi:hypothetical protein diail_10457 [Diaporthe ilicicola]|nr:hypothetical protein diail_10457 [Diaporthe ilicicola]